jgi:hypothetical protein
MAVAVQFPSSSPSLSCFSTLLLYRICIMFAVMLIFFFVFAFCAV